MLNKKESYLNISGVNTFYHVVGEGKPLIFLHGHRADAMRWDGFIYKLSKRFKVYAPDLPGYGKTQKLNTNHSMGNYAIFIADFIEALGIEKPVIFGGSMGGIIGIHLAIKNPEKIKKLVLFGTPISNKYFRLGQLKQTFIKGFAKSVTRITLIEKIFHKVVNSDIIWPLVLKYNFRREIHNQEIVNYEVNRWRSSTVQIWAETLHENLDIDFPKIIKGKIKTTTLAIFATGDKYIMVEDTLKEYEKLFENLEIVKVEVNEHLPKGPVQEEFLVHFKEAFLKILTLI